MPITDTWLKANHKKARDKAEEKADGEGLGVRCSPAGKLVFQFRFRWRGKPARLDLGSYPSLTLRAARLKHLEARAQLEAGEDPRVAKVLNEMRISTAPTVEQLFRRWYQDYCLVEKDSAPEILRSFELHVFEELGVLPADQVPAYTWADLLDKVKKEAPSIAVRILQNTKQMYRWGVRRQLVTSNPLAEFTAKEDLRVFKSSRGRALSTEEMQMLFKCLRTCRMFEGNKLYVLLCLVLGCRNGELRLLNPRTDIDFEAGLWVMPPEKNKSRKKTDKVIVRVLIPPVLDLIRKAMAISDDPDLLFSASKTGGIINARTTLSWPYTVIKHAKNRYSYDMQHWSLHDLRKTARTNFSSLTHAHVAEIMLGHSIKGMQGVYDYHDYLEDQTGAYQAWYGQLKPLSSGFL